MRGFSRVDRLSRGDILQHLQRSGSFQQQYIQSRAADNQNDASTISGRSSNDSNETKQSASSQESKFKAHDSISATFTVSHIDFEVPRIYLFLGKTKSGKSYAMKYILREAISQGVLNENNSLVFTTTKFNGQYNWLPHVTQKYDARLLNSVIAQAKAMREKYNDRIKPFFIIFDDIMGDIDMRKTPELVRLMTTYRHYNISIFIAQQYCMGGVCSPAIREQIGYIFAFANTGARSEKNIFESYCQPYFDSKKEFAATMKAITGDDDDEQDQHRCMLIDATKKRQREAISRFVAGKLDE